MTTLKDVAKRAKTSLAATSYALNGKGKISEAVRRRVFEAAEELNYHPNAFARHLKKRHTGTLGVFITRFGGSFYEEILEGIHETILATDYELIVCPESAPVRRILTQRQVDGAIIFDSKIKSETLLKLASKQFPIVTLDRQLDNEHALALLIDNPNGVQEAFEHLIAQGARQLAFVSGALDSFDNSERTRAFLLAAERHDLPVAYFAGSFTEQSGYEAGQAMLATGDRPDAVFCANDQMAIGLLRAMAERGLRAPDDLRVVGFDDIQIARYMRPSLSTVGASRRAWGGLAARQLIDYLDQGKPFEPVRIPAHFIARESSQRVKA